MSRLKIPRTGGMSVLEHPMTVAAFLREASSRLDEAFNFAAEKEGSEHNLTGAVRDMILGLRSATDALVQMLDEERFDFAPLSLHDPEDR